MLPAQTAGPAAPVRDVSLLVFLFAVFFVLFFSGILAATGTIAHLAGWPAGVGGWVKWSISAVPCRPNIFSWGASYLYISALSRAGWLWQIWASDILALLFSLPVSIWLALRISAPPPGEIHIAGRQLSEDVDQAAEEMAEECDISGQGIKIHPHVQISQDRETRHLLVSGSVGGGKTVMLLPIIKRAIARGDKCLIFDNKGDFTSALPGLIFAPWDARCTAWDIAADVQTKTDARTVAARLIVESKDPMWSNGARQLLTSIIVYLQQTRPQAWDFADLIDVSCRPFSELQAIVLQYFPEASRVIEQQSKTAQSFLITLSTYLSTVSDLADGWRDKRKFSFRRWLLEPDSPESQSASARTLILQGNERFSELQKAYIQSIISILGSIINSPELEDSTRRRIWLFLDEFPQLGKLDGFSQFLEIGRSKGLRVVMGVQDIAQLREIYSRDIVDSWSSMIGTYLVARTQGKETPKWLSELIGGREIKRYNASFSVAANDSQQANRTDSWEHTEVPVIKPNEISTSLGPKKNGVTALFHPGGDYVYRLTWPFPKKIKRRAAIILADWIQSRPSAQALARRASNANQVEGVAGIDPTTDQPKPQPPAQLPESQATAPESAEPKVLAPDPADQRPDPEPTEPDDNPMEEAGKEVEQHAVEEVIAATVGSLPPGGIDAINSISQVVETIESSQGEPIRRSVLPGTKKEPEMDELDALADLLDEEDSCSP